jgi:predicted naringenin-chalcone synthase
MGARINKKLRAAFFNQTSTMENSGDAMNAFVNRISTVVPNNDVHGRMTSAFIKLDPLPQYRELLLMMKDQCQISHRWSVLKDPEGFYGANPSLVSTAERMVEYEKNAKDLAFKAVAGLDLGDEAAAITHVVVISCTGFFSPGIDFELINRFGLNPSVERTTSGFMGCYAGVNGLKVARHIVRSEPSAKVLVVSLELCSLHVQMPKDLEQAVPYLLFGDGCAAALVSSEPRGLELHSFTAVVIPDTTEQMTWRIGNVGFDMTLSRQVPLAITTGLTEEAKKLILGGTSSKEIDLWAIHPGGRAVLDAVERAFLLPPDALTYSRRVMDRFGNMSSATIFFVLNEILKAANVDSSLRDATGCGMAFGPGLTAETFLFSVV